MTLKLEAIIMKMQTPLALVLLFGLVGVSNACQQHSGSEDALASGYFAASKVDPGALAPKHFTGSSLESAYIKPSSAKPKTRQWAVPTVSPAPAAQHAEAVEKSDLDDIVVGDVTVAGGAVNFSSHGTIQVQYLEETTGQSTGFRVVTATRPVQQRQQTIPPLLVSPAPVVEVPPHPSGSVTKPTPESTRSRTIENNPSRAPSIPKVDPGSFTKPSVYDSVANPPAVASPFESQLSKDAYAGVMQDRVDNFSRGGEPFAFSTGGGNPKLFGVASDQCCDEWQNFSRCGGLKSNPGHYGVKWLRSHDSCEQCHSCECNRKPPCVCHPQTKPQHQLQTEHPHHAQRQPAAAPCSKCR